MVGVARFLTGGGEMGARVQVRDWSTSTLGPIEAWPQSLRTTLSIMLNSGFPTCLAWSPDLISFYNDAYMPILGTKPEALGRPFPEVWSEAWDTIGPIAARALAGERSCLDDLLIVIERNRRLQESWWTFSYAPVRDETGEVGGILCTVLETTDRVLAERRLRFQIDLGKHLLGLVDPRAIMAAAAELLGRHLGAARVGYGEVDATGEFFEVERDWTDGTMPSLAGRHRLGNFGPPIMAGLRAGRTIRIDDVLSDPGTTGEATAAAFARIGMRTGIAVPMVEDGRVTATLYVNDAEPRRWRDDETALIEEVVARTQEAVAWARVQAGLQESEERFRRFAEHSTNVLWILSVEQDAMEYRSPAFERVWGRPAEILLGAPVPWNENLHPDDQEAGRNALARILSGESAVTHEYRVIRPDGSVRLIRDTCFPIRDDGGRVRRVAGIAQDITPEAEALVYVVGTGGAAPERLPLLLREAGYRVQEFATARAFMEVASVLAAGCVLLNVQTVEAADSVALLQAIATRRAGLPVVVVGGGRGNVGRAVQLMKAGAVDYLTAPDADPGPLLAAVASALAEVGDTADRDRAVALTREQIAQMPTREREVLQGLLSGATNKEIARALGISPRTVEFHRAHAMDRIGARTLPEAILLAAAAKLKPSLGRATAVS
jgi:PAS domain S-box-containing protein